MAKSKLEKKIGFISKIKRELEEIKYVGLDHYLMDVAGHIMDRKPLHYHHKNPIHKNNIFIH